MIKDNYYSAERGIFMENTSLNKKSNRICVGLLAHVDAGKTTLSEGILYTAGVIRKLGRVDHKTAFFDSNVIEKNRGITVFSKEAGFDYGDKRFTLLDTPGHVDFSAETERTLAVLDYAVLIISGADGVQSHTATLWRLLEAYGVPVFVFVNKMDQPGTDKMKLMEELKLRLGGGFAEFWNGEVRDLEEAAVCDEILMEEFLEKEALSREYVASAILKRKLFPVCFGSALKVEGVEEFLRTLEKFSLSQDYPEEFGARVYKISRDSKGTRQTHMKVTGGKIYSRMSVYTGNREEKIDMIRLYSGRSFEPAAEAEAGSICVVTGLSETYAGQGLGAENNFSRRKAQLEPALTYRVILPAGMDAGSALQKFRRIEEEEPTLQIIWKEALQEIHIKVMGRLELDILRHIAKERFDMDIDFDEGGIVYKETIAGPVIGIGHFEPLRHYAEVQVLMEPLERGSGLVFETALSEDKLDRNWQRLILTNLQEKEHLGVLTGSPITDMRITLVGGRAHLKHTEGGDFRQAAYRAVRQGLCKAESVLLEPVCSFRAEVPTANVGRVLSDMQRIGACCNAPESLKDDLSVVTGKGPVKYIKDYQQEVFAYTRGVGTFTFSPCGYGECGESREVIEEKGYDFESDIENPAYSVFCSGGSSIIVSWDKVDEMAHVGSEYEAGADGAEAARNKAAVSAGEAQTGMTEVSQKELDEIFLKTYGKSKRDEDLRRRRISVGKEKPAKPETMSGIFPQLKDGGNTSEAYFVVDGYNVIFAWEELSALASENIDSAREALIEILENYRAYKKIGMTVVFDGYKVKGSKGSLQEYGELKVIYTKEAQTADRFIEETVYRMAKSFNVTVVTSDMPVQMAALGDGAARMSSREFYREVTAASEEIRRILRNRRKFSNKPLAGKLPSEIQP